MPTLKPIRRQLIVPVGTDVAFSVFVDEIGAWWPLDRFSVFGAEAMVSVKDGQIVEVGPDGAESIWGTVLDWDPPRRLRVTWHPGQTPETATELEVSFAEVVVGQTLVTLEHRGWEAMAAPAEARAEYNGGWSSVLGRYGALAGRAAQSAGSAEAGTNEVWLALVHTPGPAIGEGERVLTHPDFPQHLAFLRRLRDERILVAAGPIGDEGEGMAVVRLPSADAVPELIRRAHEDDLSVAGDVLQVRVRPWHVALTS